jgi:hypothetical protein
MSVDANILHIAQVLAQHRCSPHVGNNFDLLHLRICLADRGRHGCIKF